MLKLKNISNDFLQNVSFDIKKWSITNILWANWAWKTTIWKIIAWLRDLKSWDILFNWENINKLNIEERSKKWLVYIFQDIPTYTNIKIKDYFWIFVKESEIDTQIFEDFWINWNDYKERNFDKQLSLNLMLGKQLFILDEIDSWLDFFAQKVLLNYIKKYNKKWKTFIIISHNKIFNDICDNSILVCNWKILTQWKTDKILEYYWNNCKECWKFKKYL